MPSLSWWMFAYGALLILIDILGLITGFQISGIAVRWGEFIGWTGGVLMIAAGLCAAQGRRSLRRGGLCVGIFLPLSAALMLAWQVGRLWHDYVAAGGSSLQLGATAIVALFSLVAVLGILHARPRDGIASRGYAVTTATFKSPAQAGEQLTDQPGQRSQAG